MEVVTYEGLYTRLYSITDPAFIFSKPELFEEITLKH